MDPRCAPCQHPFNRRCEKKTLISELQKHVKAEHKTAVILLVTYNDTLKFMEKVRKSTILKSLDTEVLLYNKNASLSNVWSKQIPDWPGAVREQRLANVGMDIYGYITYIVEHYDRLPDFVFVINGGTDRSSNKLQRLRYLVKHWPLVELCGYVDTGSEAVGADFFIDEWATNNPANRNPHGSQLTPAEVRPFGRWFETYVGPWEYVERTGVNFTNVFAVRRDRILQHPLGLYQEFQRQLERGGKQSEVAHYMERVFRSLFNQEWPPASQPRHSSSASHGSRRSRAKSRKSHQ